MRPSQDFLTQCRRYIRIIERSFYEMPQPVRDITWDGRNAAMCVNQPGFRQNKNFRDCVLAYIAAGAEAYMAWMTQPKT